MTSIGSDPTYDEARALASQLGEGLSQSTLQRRLRLGYRQARRLMDRLEAEGHIGSREHERQVLLHRALCAYAQALAGCAIYQHAESHSPRSGWSCHEDAAQVARDARETAEFYGATSDQLDDLCNYTFTGVGWSR
ncbi:DNA translocase FtsK [Streptomyces cacaoi]|uniref:DNA translocase FtsK n=1 Tax=Streptomyces cacaoi TaxID=1898 RepID=UPI0011F3006E|nr:DNA translocase FtsK [Streptomyces cacaoi]